jgi:hypothetical protein
MARISLRCCCGSLIEMRSWPAPEVEVEAWFKVHNMCAIAWQHERGLQSTISYPEQEKK